MKRFKFTTQLLIIFVLIIIISSSLFGLLMFNSLRQVSESVTLNRLNSFVEITRNEWSNGSDIKESSTDIEVFYIQGRIEEESVGKPNFVVTNYSNNLADFIDTSKGFDFIVRDLSIKPGTAANSVRKFENTERLFYSYEATMLNSNTSYFIIYLTNQNYANNFRTSTGLRIFGIFSVVVLSACVILILWGNFYVTRINRLKKHIAAIRNNNLDEVYLDNGRDELADLSSSVEVMRETIQKNEKTKQEMLQNLSHDIKTPIAVIKTYTEAIRDGMADIDSTDVILKQTNILQNKITKLLQYNKLEYLTKDEPFVDVNMKEVITSVVKNYKFQTNISINLDLKEVRYKGYIENYYVVIDNLLDNAKRYAKSRIDIVLNEKELTIYNDGLPIDEKFINSKFKPYEKGSNGQFGLGMSIVEKTLDFFGYEISVQNVKEGGVMFTIRPLNKQNIYLS